MKLDLRKEFKELLAYVRRRVRTFDPADHGGPGNIESPITRIDFGYQCDQSGWVALVFDTRPKAKPDGEWNEYIEENVLERPRWQTVCEALIQNKPVDLVLLDGTAQKLSPDLKDEEYVAIFGDLLKSVLLQARADKVFSTLPKAEKCQLGVEETDGRYGWPKFKDRGKENLA